MFIKNGFETINNFTTKGELASLCEAVSTLSQQSRSGNIRNIESKSNVVNSFANSNKVKKLVASHIGGNPILARAIYFNKTANQNWLVAWHQDKTTSVSKKTDCSGWSNWSVKDGISHAQPSSKVFDKMVNPAKRMQSDRKRQGNITQSWYAR